MAIYLGNQTISDLERHTGYVFSDEDRKWLESHRQDKAEIDFASDKFHIFDLPFEIHAAESISDYLLKLLMKYEDIKPSKEQLQFAVIKETEKQREKRLKKEKEEKEWQEKLKNPNAIWNVKWDMLVPVEIVGSNRNLYYGCFINTYTKGYKNIPNIISGGKATIYLDEDGFHGRFDLDNPEMDNDSDEQLDWNHVIGLGFYNENGNYLGHIDNMYFNEITFSLIDGIKNYQVLKDEWSYREIHFYKIED